MGYWGPVGTSIVLVLVFLVLFVLLIFCWNDIMSRISEYVCHLLHMLIFRYLWINYDLSHIHSLSMYGFSEPSLVIISSQSHAHFVHMYIPVYIDPIVLIGKYIFIYI